VRDPPADLERYDASDIRQGYLAIAEDGTEVRMRERDGDLTLTVKQGRGLVRAEEEVEMGRDAFGTLWPLTGDRRVTKRRYLIPAGEGVTIELDVYTGDLDGLVTADVEFPSAAAARRFEPPSWFGPDVTDDGRYSAQRLALDGLPD
jgi:adenylate cyclase